MSIGNVLVNEVIKVVLANKDEYIEKAKDALVAFVEEIKVDGHDQPAITELINNFSTVAKLLTDSYVLIKSLIDKYGHPAVTPQAK